MYSSSSHKSKVVFINDSDEEQEEHEDMLLACILVGEYLEEKEGPNFMLERELPGNNKLQSKL